MQLVSSNQKVGPGLVDEDVGRLGGRYLRVTRLPWRNARAHGCNFSDDTISFSAVGPSYDHHNTTRARQDLSTRLPD
jgi:hypothetical protein